MNLFFRFQFILLFVALCQVADAQLSWQGGTPPEQNQSGVLLFNATGTPLANLAGPLYLHTGITVNGTAWQNVIGNWGNNTTQPSLTLVSPNLYSLNIQPSILSFYNYTQGGTITRINVVVRNAAGNLQTQDLTLQVGAFDMTLISPIANSTQIWTGGNVAIQANHTGGAASYTLISPQGTTLDSLPSVASAYSFSLSSVTNGTYLLRARSGSLVIERSFQMIVSQTPSQVQLPAGLRDGVNYFPSDPSKATLVLNAPGKEFVYVAGNFNNWNPDASYSMNRDPASGKFWLELSGLTAGTWYAFQYWVCDNTPATNSPRIVKTADPFSTLVLSPFDDPEIVNLQVFTGLPSYSSIAPSQSREASVIQTGPNAYWQYNWTSTTKPNVNINKKDLMIYEVLIRDFDAQRTYQNLIDRFDYFKNLKINAIQLMPVMEFEGNMSWGYNPVYHMALDKRYGPPAKFKEFVDLCHQNGIAVILDIALNHVFGRSPLERMWMVDTDNDGWSNGISPDNPYCNTEPRHTLNVGADLNHFREPDNLTNTYVLRTIEQWIQEYRVDGFRWDLTQGFTNACSANDGACTGSNQPDRITKLKWYADRQWALDPNFFVIFEHWAFGEIPEYTQYRHNETPSKGILCWRRADNEYSNLLKGNGANIGIVSEGPLFRIQGNMESHDEERLVYKALTEAGQTINNLNKALDRMPALGSMFFLSPGPKMIWHFAPLGWNLSINTCSNGNLGNCRLDTKPQPQWTQNWMSVPARKKIYDDWSKMLALRTGNPVFTNGQFAYNLNQTGRPRLDVWTSTTPTSQLSYVVAFTNFSNSPATFESFFPYTGTWYNLLDNTPLVVNSTTQSITLPADGGYFVYGNQPNVLVSNKPQLPKTPSLLVELRQDPANPKNQSLWYNNPWGGKSNLQIFLPSGKLAFEFSADQTEGNIQIPENLPGGIYIARLNHQKGLAVRKVVISR